MVHVRVMCVFATFLGCTQAPASPDAPVSQSIAQSPHHVPAMDARRVEAARIEEGGFELRLTRPGEVEASQEAWLASAQGGLVEAISVKEGEEVRAGAVLARLDESLYAAQGELANVELGDAKRELERLAQLGASASRVRTDAAQTRVARAQAQLKISQLQVSRARITAPFGGVVAEVALERGEVATPGAPIVRLLRLHPVHVRVTVSDQDINALSVGTKALLRTGSSAAPKDGVILRMGAAADVQTRTFEVEVEVDNREGDLRPGTIANVTFLGQTSGDALLLPQDVLVTRAQDTGVFVVDSQARAEWKPLKLGSIVRDQVTVIEGLAAGDNLVTLGQRGLEPGDALIVARQGTCCTRGRVVYAGVAAESVAQEHP